MDCTKAWHRERRVVDSFERSRHRSPQLLAAVLVGAITCCACSAVTMVDLLPEKTAIGRGGSQPTNGQAGNGTTSLGGLGTVGVGAGGTSSVAGNTGFVSAAGAPTGLRLVNRYDFSGTGTVVVDSMSGKNGEVMGGATLDGSGQLTLTGDTRQFVKLPPWMISSFKSVTIVTWFTWHGGRAWQSVFNFGYNKSNTDAPSEDVAAEVFFTPVTAATTQPSSFHVSIVFDQGQTSIDLEEPFPVNQPMVVAAVFDGDLRQISLFYNGAMVKAPAPLGQFYPYHSLSELKDANCWLGQSQWAHDVTNSDNFRGVYDEFRIYNGALTAEQIANLSLTDPYRL
jgi:hypothetical protein